MMNRYGWLILCALLIMLIPSTAFAQDGPMGIGNKDGTSTSAGPQPRLLLWLDGSSARGFDGGGNPTLYGNNTPVDVWIDKSGNENNFVPYFSGGTYRPDLKTGGTFSGPKGSFTGAPETPAIKFLNRDDHLYCPDFELPGDGYTIYFVIKTTDNNFGLFSYATSTSEREMLIYNNSGIRQQMITSIDRSSVIGNLSNGNWNYGGIQLSTVDDDNWEFTKNSYLDDGYNNFNGITFSETGSAMIGNTQNAAGSYPTGSPDEFEGSIAEIILYEGRISRPATRLLRTYLWVKYGLNGDSGGWDKYHGNMNIPAGNEWGGKYYAPIGIGNDIVNPNAGSVNEARSEGLVLRVNQGEWTQTRSYLCAAPVGNSITGLATNTVTTQGVGVLPTVIERWSRLWEISGNNEGNGQIFQIGFDFGEGIDGDIPQNPENFVLLYTDDPINGDFTILPITGADKFVLDDQLVFKVSKSALLTPNRYYTIGTTDVSSTLTGDLKRTWYAYQTGNWSDTLTWTLDGSASPSYVNPGGDTPKLYDNVHIGTGRKVTLDTTIPNLGDLKVFGTLDLASSAQPSFLTIAGSGLIKCAAGNFPIGNSTAFADPIIGGTLEFYGNGGFTQPTNLEVNKLKINLLNTSSTITLAANLTNNGLFEVNKGTFIINNTANTPRILTSNANVLVENEGIVKVNDAPPKTTHKWYFYKDLINNGGQIKFTNRTAANENYSDAYYAVETNDIVTAYFSSASNNQELRANGPSYFSRIVIDKGVDMTYILSISSGNPTFFKLLGPCRYGMAEEEYLDETGNLNSFALINGTVEIRENIFIPLLTNNGNYNINHTAQLWLNGGEATKGPLGGPGTQAALVNYGIVKISSGVLNVFTTSGITIRGNGVVQVDGGMLNANQIRTSLLGPTNIGGLIINDGIVNIDGNRPEGALGTYYTLSLTYPGNLFRMTGGTLNITGPTSSGLIFINSDPQNTSVSGGTVHLDVSDTKNTHRISSRAAFWDLTLTRSNTSTVRNFLFVDGNSGPDTNKAYIADQDLIVRNKLSIIGLNTPKLEMGTVSNPADLYLYGDLKIDNGCVYIHQSNTTHFVGSSNSSLTFGGSTTFPFYNIEVKKDFDSRYVKIQNSGPLVSMDILGSLSLERGYFNNNTKFVELKGNITNRTQFGEDGVYGYLRMNGNSGRQQIISDGGVFHKLLIENPDGVELKNDGITVKTWLKLEAGSFFIGDHKLRMETTDANVIFGGNTTDRFVVCSGNASAGGVEILNHSDSQTLSFPIGVNTGSGPKYTDAVIYINSGWMDDGFVRVTPVDTLLSTSDLSGTSDYLNYYWKVSSTNYDIKPNVTHRFRYVDEDVRGTEASFEPGRVLSELPFTRSIDSAPVSSHVNLGSNLIYYNGADQAIGTTGTGTALVNADYTAGAADRFIGSPEVFFSRSTIDGASWETPGNWNKLSECNSCSGVYDYHSTTKLASDSLYPKGGDIAVIGFNVNFGGKPHVYKAPPGGIEVAQVLFTPLQDIGGARQPRYNGGAEADLGVLRPTLEISNTSDIVKVAQISGEGELMLKGDIDLGVTDIGGFLAEDSSIVVINNGYSTLTLNFLPAVIPNLFLALALPNITSDIHIRGNLEVAGRSRLYLSESLRGNIEIDGDLILDDYQSATVEPKVLFNKRGTLKTIQVHGDVKLLGSVAQIGINTSGGPVVPPAEWTPEELNAFLWLDATDTSTVVRSGVNVTGWNNKATGLYNSAQIDPNKQPTYQTSAALNGLSTIRFDGVDDFLSIPHNANLNLLANQDFEIFAVTQINNYDGGAPDGYPVIYGKGKTSNDDFLLYVAINTFRLYMDVFGINAPNSALTAANFGWVRRQGNNAFLYNTLGGNNSTSGAGSRTNFSNVHNVTIGAAEDGTLRFLNGDIGEIILIKRALTNDERQQMEGYLAHKWGLEADLPDGHPYKNEVPLIGGNDNISQLIVDGDIIQNLSNTTSVDNGVELYNTGMDTSFVNLVVTNAGVNQFNNLSGPTPRLWKLKVDKGINTTSSFTFNTDVDISGPADETEKPVNIQNGLLKFNNSNIDITLSSGGGDFLIPFSGGLELNNGDLKIRGNETGMLLLGELKITNGSLIIGENEGVNNYIEYSSTGSPKINISGGNLIVGSQIRRGLSSTGGALDYRQSGGNVIVGRYASPESSRGMLEVLNPGSRFEHTGGTLTFVRGVNLGSTPSLLLTPAITEVSGSSEIIIGNTNSPSGAAIQNFGIQSSTALNSLTINSNNSPLVHLITSDLVLNGDLTIHIGATLNCIDRNLQLHQDVINDGVLSATSGKVSLIHPVSGTVSGSGVFDLYDLERSGGIDGQTLVQRDLLVKNNFINDNGEMNFEGNTLTVKGNVTTDGDLKFDTGSNGLIFSGATPQILIRSGDGTSEIDAMTISNDLGVTIPAGYFHFIINKTLRLDKGIFALTGNRLEMATGSSFIPVNPFSETNMIVTGGAFANDGVLIHIPANSHDDIFIPLGIDRYMPVNLDFAQSGYSSGSTASTYLLRLNIPENGVVIQDTEVPGPQINDKNNVLGMFFSVDGTDIGNGLKMDLKFHYDDQYVQVTTPYTETDYTTAWVRSDNTTISKLGPTGVDEVNNILTFHAAGDYLGNQNAIDGDYFAGVDDAIPSTIITYIVNVGFNQVEDGADAFGNPDAYDLAVPGGGAPSGALVIVPTGSFLSFKNIDGVNFYRTEIQAGAFVIIDRTSQHRLGKVTGEGTINLRGTGNLPAGDYTDFFGCPGGKLEYQANALENFEVLSNMPPIDEVTLRGPGNITIADNAVNICNNLTVTGSGTIKAANAALLTVGGNLYIVNGVFDLRQGNTLIKGDVMTSGTAASGGHIHSGNSGKVTIEGDLLIGGKGFGLGTVFRETHVEGNVSKNTSPTLGSIQDGTGGAKLVLNGTDPQTITGDFTGTSKIPFIELNNGTGLTLAGNVDISDTLKLTNGNIFTSAGNILKLTEDGTDVDPVGGHPNSFVDGPMQWTLSASANERKFPIGKNDRYRPLSISDRSATRTWEVEYTDTIARIVPTIDPYMLPDPTNVPTIETVSVQEFWRVDSRTPASTIAKIRLSWGDSSAVSTNTSDQSKLLVLAYNDVTDVWDSYGGTDFHYNAPTNRGDVLSDTLVTFTQRYLTLGSSDALNPLPVTWLYFTGENKETDNILSWATATEKNNDYFELERSLDANNWTSIAKITAAGYSTSKQIYTYTDTDAPIGRVYYRLQQVDFDGQRDFAPNVVSLERGFTKEAEVFDFVLYPNPTRIGTFRFRMSNTYDVRADVSIYDLSGKFLSQEYVQIDGQGTSASVNCNLDPGIYLVTIIVNDKMRSKPLVITR